MPDPQYFRGVDGAMRMSPETKREPKNPATFLAVTRSYRFRNVEIVELHTDAFRATREQAEIDAEPLYLVRVIYVSAGGIRVRQDGRSAFVGAGDVVAIRTNAPYETSVSDGGVLFTVSFSISEFSTEVRGKLSQLTARGIVRPAVFAAAGAFLGPYLREDSPTLQDDAGIDDLVISTIERVLLVESVESDTERNWESRMLERAIARIADLLASPALTPASLAADLGLSSRNLYRLFDEEELSVAAHIRAARLDALAHLLRTEHPTPPLPGLAERFGFRSHDACARVFKIRFGVTMSEYAALAPTGERRGPRG